MERYSCSLQSLVVSLLLPLLSTLIVSRTEGLLSHLNSLTSRLLLFPLSNLCSVIALAVPLSSGLQRTKPSIVLTFLELAESRILHLAPAIHTIQNTSHLILHCPATDSLRRSLFGNSLSLYDLWSRPRDIARFWGLYGLLSYPHPSEGIG